MSSAAFLQLSFSTNVIFSLFHPIKMTAGLAREGLFQTQTHRRLYCMSVEMMAVWHFRLQVSVEMMAVWHFRLQVYKQKDASSFKHIKLTDALKLKMGKRKLFLIYPLLLITYKCNI